MLLTALLAMILIMRGPVTCVGVLTEPVMTTFGIGYSAFGFLCALPIACFGLCGLLGPVVSARTGLSRALTLSVLFVLVGAAGRLVTDYATLLLSTVFIATGIAFLNVLMPVLLKQNFPERADVAMGLFTGFIGFSGAIGTYVSVPMWERWGTLTAPFGLWVALSALALLAWWAAPKKGAVTENRFHFGAGFLRNPMVWAVMLVMSMQSLTIYTTAAWLPTILKTEGFSAADAGFGVAAFLLISAPASIFSPWIVRVCGGGRRTSFLCALNFAVGVFLWLRGGRRRLRRLPHGGGLAGARLQSRHARHEPEDQEPLGTLFDFGLCAGYGLRHRGARTLGLRRALRSRARALGDRRLHAGYYRSVGRERSLRLRRAPDLFGLRG